MSEMPLVLLVTSRTDWSPGLKSILERSGCAVYVAANTADAALLIHSYSPPHLVFTDMQLADGSWTGILSLAETSPLPVNVVVVSPFTDIDVYVRVLERGAFDFIVPPLEVSEVDHIVRCGLGNALIRRDLRRGAEGSDSPPAPGRITMTIVDDDFEMAPSL